MTPSRHALICAPLLPTLPPGRRAAVRDGLPQVRGGRCRSNAARAKCARHNGFHPPSVCAARKRVDDALRRFGLHTPRIPDAVIAVSYYVRCWLVMPRFCVPLSAPVHSWHAGKTCHRSVAWDTNLVAS